MSQALSNVLVHLVFSTKERRPFLSDREIRTHMHERLGGTSNTLNCQTLIVGGIEDHVHLLARQSRTISLADWVKELKRATSVWMKEQDRSFARFAWQSGYGAFSVSHSQISEVRRYIQNQEQHHRKFDFRTELRTLLEKHQVEFDERYVWN